MFWRNYHDHSPFDVSNCQPNEYGKESRIHPYCGCNSDQKGVNVKLFTNNRCLFGDWRSGDGCLVRHAQLALLLVPLLAAGAPG